MDDLVSAQEQQHAQTLAPAPVGHRRPDRHPADRPGDGPDRVALRVAVDGCLIPWTDAECIRFVRREFAVEGLHTTSEIAATLGFSMTYVRETANRLGAGRFLFGKIRYTDREVAAIRSRLKGGES